MLDIEVVDCHHHIWDLRNSYPWLQEDAGRLQVHGDDTPIRKDYLLDAFLADAAEVPLVRSVHVDAGAADGWAESQWLQAVADERGYPHAIVAGVKLDVPAVAEDLERHTSLPNFRGVRHILNWHPDSSLTYVDRKDLIDDPRWRAGFALLERHGLSFDLQVYPHQLKDAVRLADDHPSTRIFLNHAGMPLDRTDEGMNVWRRGLQALAARDNAMIKISGLGMTDHDWSVDSIRPIVLDCITAFGPSRAMFGSNFPVDAIYSSYGAIWSAFDDITAEFSRDERALLFGGTAREAYRI